MFEKLKETYGMKLSVSAEKQLKGLPFYMLAGRKIYEVQCQDVSFLAVVVPNGERFGSIALDKQLAQYQKAAEMPAAYVFDRLSYAQRTALISRHIPFISEPDQIYLPFLGVMLRERLNQKLQPQADNMSPATQCLFLFLTYSGQHGCLKKDAAERLGLTRTSISRASEQLALMGLIREEKRGKEIWMYPACSGRESFDAARTYLINPVQRVLYTERTAAIKGLVLSGESALGAATMLNAPAVPVYAVDKNADLAKSLQEIDPKWETDKAVCRIEIWKYNPALFASGGCADPISLAMSLQEQGDERVEAALEEYMGGYSW